MSPSVNLWLINGFFIVFGQQWSSVAQMNQIHQALATQTISVSQINTLLALFFFFFSMAFVHSRKMTTRSDNNHHVQACIIPADIGIEQCTSPKRALEGATSHKLFSTRQQQMGVHVLYGHGCSKKLHVAYNTKIFQKMAI